MNINDIKKVKENRHHKISGSLGVYDAYRWIRKNKYLNLSEPITTELFYKIIRTVNKLLIDKLLTVSEVKLPHHMGLIEIRKLSPSLELVNNKVKTNQPIDWNRTVKLWSEDKESKDSKLLVKAEFKLIFFIKYNKKNANYNNKTFFKFRPMRSLKLKIHKQASMNNLEAFIVK